jgi:cysteine desulfurase
MDASISTGSRRPAAARGALVALQGANNETGVIQPVAEAAALVHAADGFLFCDAVQWPGGCPRGRRAGADALMLSAHKMGGLKERARLSWRVRGQQARRSCGRRPGARGAGTEGGTIAASLRHGHLCRVGRELARLIGLRDRLTIAMCLVAADAVIFAGACRGCPTPSASPFRR